VEAPADATLGRVRLPALVRRFPFARFVRFCVVGGSGVVVNYGVYLPLTRFLHVLEETALAVSIGVSILTNFALNELWTFRDRRSGGQLASAGRLARFVVVSLVGAAIQWGVFTASYRLAGINDKLAVLLGIGVATAWNFFLNLIWTWRARRGPGAGPPGGRATTSPPANSATAPRGGSSGGSSRS
jgi:putative flippase GtrA